MYKISEQQINNKLFSVPNSCQYNENYTDRLMRTRQDLPQQISKAKIRMQNPQNGDKLKCKSLGIHQLTTKIDSRIIA